MPSLDSYYQPDFSHRSKPKKTAVSSAPQYEIGLDGVPVLTNRTIQPTSRPNGVPDLRGSVTPGSMEPATTNLSEGIQMQIAERHRAGAGYSDGVKKPDYYPVESRTILPRQETVTNKAGVVQSGKNLGGGGTPIDMSRTFDALLKDIGVQPFGGSQLPTTKGNPFSQTSSQAPAFDMSQGDFGGRAAVNFDAEGGISAVNSKNLQDQAPFNPGAPLIEGGSERIAQQATGISSGRLSDALEGVRTQEANREMTPERRRAMASMAFYNADGGLEGLKARDAVNDVVYAGGQHWGRGALTEDSKYGDKYKIDRDDARDIASGKQTAAGLLDVYKTRIKESAGSTTPAEAQEPVTLEKPGVKQSFQRTETISSPINTSIPDTTAFESNNGVDVPAFGNTGGYKPISKKLEVDYSSIFK
jgi:hypothetical protein